MVKLKALERDEIQIRNVHYFSSVIAAAVREASAAVHPASIAGVLYYHANGVSMGAQAAFHKPESGPSLFTPDGP